MCHVTDCHRRAAPTRSVFEAPSNFVNVGRGSKPRTRFIVRRTCDVATWLKKPAAEMAKRSPANHWVPEPRRVHVVAVPANTDNDAQFEERYRFAQPFLGSCRSQLCSSPGYTIEVVPWGGGSTVRELRREPDRRPARQSMLERCHFAINLRGYCSHPVLNACA